jgi:hypothetical protein
MPEIETRGEARGGDDRRPLPVVISEDTPIRLRIVIGIIAGIFFFLAGIVGGVWWAATTTSQLSSIEKQNAAILAAQSLLRADAKSQGDDIADLKAWRKMVEQQGDPASRVRDEALQNQINKLSHDFDVMLARGKP